MFMKKKLDKKVSTFFLQKLSKHDLESIETNFYFLVLIGFWKIIIFVKWKTIFGCFTKIKKSWIYKNIFLDGEWAGKLENGMEVDHKCIICNIFKI